MYGSVHTMLIKKWRPYAGKVSWSLAWGALGSIVHITQFSRNRVSPALLWSVMFEGVLGGNQSFCFLVLLFKMTTWPSGQGVSPAKLMGFARVGLNPTVVVDFYFFDMSL